MLVILLFHAVILRKSSWSLSKGWRRISVTLITCSGSPYERAVPAIFLSTFLRRWLRETWLVLNLINQYWNNFLATTYLFLILMLGTGQNEIIYLTQRATISKIPAQHDFGDIRFQNKLWSGFPRFMFKDHWRVHVHTNPTPSSPAVPHIPILS